MLKILRVTLAVLSFMAVLLLFVDFTGTAARLWPWMAKIQLVPALLSFNVAAIVLLLLVTLLFGRVYCSVICPLGITEDAVISLRRRFAPKRRRRAGMFRYEPAHRKLRAAFLAVFLLLVVLGLTGLVATSWAGLLEPYSAFGRIASSIFAPGARALNNIASELSPADSYVFGPVSQASISGVLLAVALVSFVVITVIAWLTGRGYCNAVCPVGTLLGFFSRYSFLKPVIDTSKCNRCGSCGRHCKSQCIDTVNHRIDSTRCVACMDCIGVCRQGAISFSRRPRKVKNLKTSGKTSITDTSRRSFMLAGAALAGNAIVSAADKTVDGGLTPLKRKQAYPDRMPAVPAGAVSVSHLRRHCTACQLCIANCPEGILRPSSSLDSLMQPVMLFTDGFCRPECTRCSDICPAGAFHPLSVEEKSAIKIGRAVVDYSICLSATGEAECGSCARNCPAAAISMVPVDGSDTESPLMPVVDDSACIGCGSCEYHCPVGTVQPIKADRAAIHIEGLEIHRPI